MIPGIFHLGIFTGSAVPRRFVGGPGVAYALLRAARLRESPECLDAAKKFLDPWRGRVVQQAPWIPWILVLGLILEHPFLELTLGQVASW